MDEIVARAMQKWPDVPNVFGWLRLDRRGRWLVKSRSGAFERIGNAAVTAFIGRNYGADAKGRWFFQNGPQRVFVSLDYTPWVLRLSDDSGCLLAHNDVPFGTPSSLLLDEQGQLLVASASGVGVVSDRDLQLLFERLDRENPADDGGVPLDERLAAGSLTALRLFGVEVPLRGVISSAVADEFGFNPDPRPAPGEPDC